MSGWRLKNQRGFTMVELMIATTVFSVILLVAGSGVIAIGRMYYKNITSTRVQETSRAVMDDVTRSLQFSAGVVSAVPTTEPGIDTAPGDIQARCFGNDRFTYVVNSIPGSGHGLQLDRTPTTGCSNENINDSKQLLGENMRLLRFYVSPGNRGVFEIKVAIAYGDNDLLTPYDGNGNPLDGSVTFGEAASALCKGGPGSSFCSVSGLETVVNSRID